MLSRSICRGARKTAPNEALCKPSGKTDLEDVPILLKMKKDGLIEDPIFLPEWVTDMNYLVSYFVFSNFVGKMDYDSVDDFYGSLFK